MLGWLSNHEKITSQSNFKLRFSRKFWDVVRGFLLEPGVICLAAIDNHQTEKWPL